MGSTRFAQWIRESGLTQAEVAVKLDCSHSWVCRVARGDRLPGREMAVNIERLTERWERGAIRPAEWTLSEDDREAAG